MAKSKVSLLGSRVTANSGFLAESVILIMLHEVLGTLRVFRVHMKLNSWGKPAGNICLQIKERGARASLSVDPTSGKGDADAAKYIKRGS